MGRNRILEETKLTPRDLVEMGDMAAWALRDANWWLGEKSYNLGIVNQNGGIDMNGEIARAFVKGFKGSKV